MVCCRDAFEVNHIRNQPEKIKMEHAIAWLIKHPKETAAAAAHLHYIEKEGSMRVV